MSNSLRLPLGKISAFAAAAVIAGGVIVAGGATATAANPHSSAANDSLVCKNVTGTISFSPKLTSTGYTSGAIHTTIHATVSHCTVTGAFHTTVTKGTVSGMIVGAAGTSTQPSGTCTGLLGSIKDVGRLTTTWTATPSDPDSVLNVRSVLVTFPTWRIPGSMSNSAPTGSFRGTAGTGLQDKVYAKTVLTSPAYEADCNRTGITSLAIETDSGPPAENALSLNS